MIIMNNFKNYIKPSKRSSYKLKISNSKSQIFTNLNNNKSILIATSFQLGSNGWEKFLGKSFKEHSSFLVHKN